MEQPIVISPVYKYEKWRIIFDYFINDCTDFVIYYPDGLDREENLLLVGREKFKKLSDVVIEPWEGMESSIQIKGKLDFEAKNLFFHYMNLSFKGDRPSLWYFHIYKEDRLILHFEDFSLCLLYLDHDSFNDLYLKTGVSKEDLEKLSVMDTEVYVKDE